MMLPPDLQLQQDMAARFQADEFLSAYAVTLEADGYTEADVQQALGPTLAGGIAGKVRGFLISVLITEDGRDEKVNVPGPMEEFQLTVRVAEVPKVSRAAAKSAGKPYLSYSHLVRRVKQLGHQFQLGSAPVLYLRALAYNDGAGTVGKEVLFSWKPSPQFAAAVARPTFQKQPDGSLVLATNTAGATIYATEDGNLPTPGAPFASVAGAPLALEAPAAGVLVRAVAYKDGMTASGASELQA